MLFLSFTRLSSFVFQETSMLRSMREALLDDTRETRRDKSPLGKYIHLFSETGIMLFIV